MGMRGMRGRIVTLLILVVTVQVQRSKGSTVSIEQEHVPQPYHLSILDRTIGGTVVGAVGGIGLAKLLHKEESTSQAAIAGGVVGGAVGLYSGTKAKPARLSPKEQQPKVVERTPSLIMFTKLDDGNQGAKALILAAHQSVAKVPYFKLKGVISAPSHQLIGSVNTFLQKSGLNIETSNAKEKATSANYARKIIQEADNLIIHCDGHYGILKLALQHAFRGVRSKKVIRNRIKKIHLRKPALESKDFVDLVKFLKSEKLQFSEFTDRDEHYLSLQDEIEAASSHEDSVFYCNLMDSDADILNSLFKEDKLAWCQRYVSPTWKECVEVAKFLIQQHKLENIVRQGDLCQTPSVMIAAALNEKSYDGTLPENWNSLLMSAFTWADEKGEKLSKPCDRKFPNFLEAETVLENSFKLENLRALYHYL